jgi:hypothetical protein
VALFLAHEPALVAFGRRGQRVREQDGVRARRMLVLALAAGAALGVVGLYVAPHAARVAAAVAATLAIFLTAAVALGIEKTLSGELIAAAAMTSAALPVLTASGVSWRDASSIWAAWLFGFTAAVFPVRAVIVEHKERETSPAVRVTGTLAAIACTAVLALIGELPTPLVLADVPLFVAALFIALRPPGMKEMTRAGWMLMAAGALTTVAMIAVVRLHWM